MELRGCPQTYHGAAEIAFGLKQDVTEKQIQKYLFSIGMICRPNIMYQNRKYVGSRNCDWVLGCLACLTGKWRRSRASCKSS